MMARGAASVGGGFRIALSKLWATGDWLAHRILGTW